MPHPHSYAHVPGSRSEWPQAGDPAQDLAELMLRQFSSHQPRPRRPLLSAECGGPGEKAGGERDNQQTQVVPPDHLTLRQTALWAVSEHRRAQKDCLSPSPQEIWNGYILMFLFLQHVVR